jgi:integrase
MSDERQQILSFLAYARLDLGLSANSINAYANDLNQWLDFLNSQKSNLQKAERELLENFLATLVDQNIEGASIRRKLSSLRSFYRWRKKELKLTVDPTAGIRSPKAKKQLPKTLSLEELEKIFQVIGTDSPEGVRDRYSTTGTGKAENLTVNVIGDDRLDKVLGRLYEVTSAPIESNTNIKAVNADVSRLADKQEVVEVISEAS